MKRDTSNDGLKNKLEYYALTHFQPLWNFLQNAPSLERAANAFLLNRAVTKARSRPHPLSLMSDYTSWDSLTDRVFTGRHLPPTDDRYTKSLPSVEDVTAIFLRPPGKGRVSSTSTQLFSNFAQWFTDGFLRTDRKDYRKNTSNHEIDLSPLYGRTKAMTDALRSKEGGQLKSQMICDCEFPPYFFNENGEPKTEFGDVGILYDKDLPEQLKKTLFAMGVERANVQIGFVMLNVLFLREHNRLCKILAAAHPSWDDERLFQTARNTLIVILIKVVIEDYINHLAPYHFSFKAQPQSAYHRSWYRTNRMTIEFNMLYRWHGLVTNSICVNGEEVNIEDTLFNNPLVINRGLGGCFDDASRQPCGAIGLLNTPAMLIGAETASLKLGRLAHLQPYNAYREYCGYPAVTSFDQITGDSERQRLLRDLYKRPENVELYTGLFAEDERPGSPLSPLIGRLVGVDAFSQALTNPLLSDHVFNEKTFSSEGWKEITNTKTLSDIVHRNLQGESSIPLVTMYFEG